MKVLTDISTNGKKIFKTIEAGGGIWGSITGLIDNQLDLISKFAEKLNLTGGTITGDLNVTGNLSQNGVNVGLLAYPVGAIYQSTVATSPATLFGGTWVALTGRFLIGADGTYTAGSTGGVTSHTHTSASHTHTSASHSHGNGDLHAQFAFYSTSSLIMNRVTGVASWADNFYKTVAGGTGSNPGSNTVGVNVNGNTSSTTPGATGSTTPGATGGTNNIPPYRSVYQWYRSA